MNKARDRDSRHDSDGSAFDDAIMLRPILPHGNPNCLATIETWNHLIPSRTQQ